MDTSTSSEEIIDRQKEFYQAHKTLHWHDKSYKEINKNTIVVDYECKVITNDGKSMSWSGPEHFTVKNGKITRIEIKIKP